MHSTEHSIVPTQGANEMGRESPFGSAPILHTVNTQYKRVFFQMYLSSSCLGHLNVNVCQTIGR